MWNGSMNSHTKPNSAQASAKSSVLPVGSWWMVVVTAASSSEQATSAGTTGRRRTASAATLPPTTCMASTAAIRVWALRASKPAALPKGSR